MKPKKTNARVGLTGSGEFVVNPALNQAHETDLTGSGTFTLEGNTAPQIVVPEWEPQGNLVVENYEDVSSDLEGRAVPIQNVKDPVETIWFLDNIGTGSQCCDADGNVIEYTAPLSGLSVEIPRTVHGITGFPDVLVLTPSGAEVGVCVEYIGESIFITSNVLLDNHTAILR